jgi:hypothetical protein
MNTVATILETPCRLHTIFPRFSDSVYATWGEHELLGCDDISLRRYYVVSLAKCVYQYLTT